MLIADKFHVALHHHHHHHSREKEPDLNQHVTDVSTPKYFPVILFSSAAVPGKTKTNMFRDHPPGKPPYAVCVLEAAKPSECPSKVKLSVQSQKSRCLAWGSGYKKVTTFRFTGESNLDTRDPAARPLHLPDSGWHTSHGLDPATHACRTRLPGLSSSSVPHSPTSASPPCWPVLISSGVPISASTASYKLDSAYSVGSACGYIPVASQPHGCIICTSQAACLNLDAITKASVGSGEGSEMHVSITRCGGWKSTMFVPLEDFLQQLKRSELAGKELILRVRWEDKVIDVEVAPTPPEEMEALREAESCGPEMNVMSTAAEDRRDWRKDEEDQESYGGGKSERDGEQDTGKEAYDRETEREWEANKGTWKNEDMMEERKDMEYTVKEDDRDERMERQIEDEGIWEGNKATIKDEIAMRETINAEHRQEEFKIDITMKITVIEPHKDVTTRATLRDKEEQAAQHEEPGRVEAPTETDLSFCVCCLLLPLFVVSFILLMYVWVRNVPL